jgi:Trk-type K+ transport system membrane component
MSRTTWARPRLTHPAQVIVGGFAAAVMVGTTLLLLPVSRAGSSGSAGLLDALFTATSATCVTGLVTVDTATYWSPFGQGAILRLWSSSASAGSAAPWRWSSSRPGSRCWASTPTRRSSKS